MKTRYVFLLMLYCSLTVFSSFGQSAKNQQERIAAAKAELKKQLTADTSDYRKAVSLFQQLVKENSRNAELHYFFGCALDKMNSNEARGMADIGIELVIRSSEQFETVNKLQPVYKGEILLLDPYSKIGSIWGSMAMAYLAKGAIDSGKWAFTEGKKRGGFIEPVLEYTRQLMSTCDSNAILITYGDLSFFPVMYLQMVENFRKDIVTVDANLVHTVWYAKWLKQGGRIKMGYSMAELDSLSYKKWEAEVISINDPHDSTKALSWLLAPTYMQHYILQGDLVLLDVLKHNFFDRPVYFPSQTDTTFNLFLNDNLIGEGLLSRLVMEGGDPWRDEQCLKNLRSFNVNRIDSAEICRSSDAISLVNGFRYAYYNKAYQFGGRDETEEMKLLVEEMEKKFSKSRLPYVSKEIETAFTEFIKKAEE